MKKFYLFIYILFITFLSFLCFCMKVNASGRPVSPNEFWIDSQTSDPFTITLSGNSSANHTFNYYQALTASSMDNLNGDYYMFSVVSDKKINIKRRYDIGTHCSVDCWANDSYLSLVSKNGSAYNYLFYFSAKLVRVTLGTQIIEFEIHDDFTFTNLESGTATIKIYGVYAEDDNPLPNVLENAASAANIINSAEENTNNIIENDNDNTQSVIDNDNANTDKIIESNKSCTKFSATLKDSYINANGNKGSTPNWYASDFIKITNGELKVTNALSSSGGTYYCFYDDTKTKINCSASPTSIGVISVPNNAVYIRYSSYQGLPIFEYCKNGNQAVNDSINDLNGTIQNGDIDNPNSDLDDISNMVAENGVITNLLSLPITLYSKILNSVNGTCSTYNLGQLYGTNITFSCISLQTLLGSTIWGVIDILFSGFTIYAIAKKMIKVFNNMSSLKEGDVIDD